MSNCLQNMILCNIVEWIKMFELLATILYIVEDEIPERGL